MQIMFITTELLREKIKDKISELWGENKISSLYLKCLTKI